MPSFAIHLSDIHDAARRVAPHVLTTPCVASERLSRQYDCRLFFKAENLQHIGAFKARGATNAVLSLTEAQAAAGVVTHSSGNHAAALARAARIREIPAHIVMPHNSAKTKIAAVRSLGVEPIFCEPTAEARERTAESVRLETGATLVHPYNNPMVMAGQGTVGLEILEQVEDVDIIVCPVGGGGLLSGVLAAIKSLRPEVQVIAAEPELADDAFRSMQSGQIEMPTRYDTIADGLRTPLGDHTFPIIHALVDEVLLVNEADIRTAMRTLAEDVHLVVEPSGAVSCAAVKAYADRFVGKTTVAIISGGNVDFGECKLGSNRAS